jgi:hypothetical protein
MLSPRQQQIKHHALCLCAVDQRRLPHVLAAPIHGHGVSSHTVTVAPNHQAEDTTTASLSVHSFSIVLVALNAAINSSLPFSLLTSQLAAINFQLHYFPVPPSSASCKKKSSSHRLLRSDRIG